MTREGAPESADVDPRSEWCYRPFMRRSRSRSLVTTPRRLSGVLSVRCVLVLLALAVSCGGGGDGSGATHTAADDSHNVSDTAVYAGKAIYVILDWHTPGDADETDTGPEAGSDLDVHLLHPNAPSNDGTPDLDGDGEPDPYFDSLYDCYWYNPHPDWGNPGVDGDPVLDRDDTDGMGPERVGMEGPEHGARFRIAAHYWSDHGYGESAATVRVYTDEDLVYQETLTLAESDLWCVGFVSWPSGDFSLCDEDLQVTHDYQPKW
jgi:hypothetical protein